APCCTGVNTGSCACAGPNPHKSCTSDADCASIADSCQPTANCFFGPPLAIPNPSIANASSCNINVVKTDASGTGNPTTGDATVDIPLPTRAYLTGNQRPPCPQCNCAAPPRRATAPTGCTYAPN